MRDLHIDVNNNIFVTDSDNNQVIKFIPYSSLGVLVSGGGATGSAANQLNSLFGNFIDPNGTLYVADDENFRVMKYLPRSLNGIIVAENGTTVSGSNQLARSISIIVDNNGYVIRLFYLIKKLLKSALST
jgi:hypothetical protein